MNKKIVTSIVCVLLLGLAGASSAKKRRSGAYFAAKFVCGNNTSAEDRVVPGLYATSINILNPSDKEAEILASVALTFPPSMPEAGAVSDPNVLVLPGPAALQIDCEEIPEGFSFEGGPPMSEYFEGFLILRSRAKLRVTGVYTVEASMGEVSIDVETIEGNKFRAKDDDRGKLVICHVPPGNPDAAHTIVISKPAWRAHKSHGDTKGECEDF